MSDELNRKLRERQQRAHEVQEQRQKQVDAAKQSLEQRISRILPEQLRREIKLKTQAVYNANTDDVDTSVTITIPTGNLVEERVFFRPYDDTQWIFLRERNKRVPEHPVADEQLEDVILDMFPLNYQFR